MDKSNFMKSYRMILYVAKSNISHDCKNMDESRKRIAKHSKSRGFEQGSNHWCDRSWRATNSALYGSIGQLSVL